MLFLDFDKLKICFTLVSKFLMLLLIIFWNLINVENINVDTIFHHVD